MRENITFTNTSRFSVISAFTKARTEKKLNLLDLLGQSISHVLETPEKLGIQKNFFV